MRRVTIFLSLCMFFAAQAQNPESKSLSLPAEDQIFDISLLSGSIQFHISIPEIYIEEIEREGDKYVRLLIPGFYNSGVPGEPSLPVFSSLIENATLINYTLQISSMDSLLIDLDEQYPGCAIFPAQPSLQKTNNIIVEELLKNDSIYESDQWTDLLLIDIEKEGRMRGMDIGRFIFNPVKYHAGKNEIKVFYNIQGELTPDEAVVSATLKEPSLAFDRIMSSVIQGETKSFTKKLIRDEPMTFVILSDPLFRSALQPFIKWKKQKGFKIIEAYTDDPQVGTDRESIKSYLSALYTSPPAGYSSPSYLLIVGDVEHIPLSQSGGQITDLFYTTYDGPADYLPELIQGRISVKNETELNVIVNKILEYEKYLFPDESFLSKSILIAGSGSGSPDTYGNGQINYASNYYFNEAHGISANVNLHPAASLLGTEIRSAIAQGAAFVNYTGHGKESGWIDPSFNTGHISMMQNKGRYPVLIGNGCRTNVFSLPDNDCFAEAIVKAEDKGAIAYIGCTNDSYWKEDFYWSVGVGPETANPVYESTSYGFYDKVFHDGDEPDSIWAPSLGEMIFAGNMTVQQSASSYKEYYWMIYQLNGDPTLVPWFSVPEDPTVIFPASLPPEASFVNIEAQVYDYAAISAGDTLLDGRHADESGAASLFIPEEFRGDTLLMVVTGDNRKPFIRQIPDIGYFKLVDIHITDESVLADSILSNGEQASFNMLLTNTASSPSDEVDLVLSSSGKGIVIIDSLALLPVVNPGDTIELKNVFSFRAPGDMVDLSEEMLTFVRSGDIISNYMNHSVQVKAPVLTVTSFTVSDVVYGNGNGMLEQGEKVSMAVELCNAGSYASDSIIIEFASSDTLFSYKNIIKGNPLDTGETVRYTADFDIPEFGGSADFLLVPIYIGDGNYFLDSMLMVLGKYYADFSADSLSKLPWKSMDWIRDTMEYFTGPASLRSADIGNRESTSFGIMVHVFEDDSISFNYKVSSEAGYDDLRFYVDNKEVQRWSGEIDWSDFSHKLGNGLHELVWMYKKDLNTSTGKDAAWVDDIVFPKYSFIPDLYIDSIYILRSGSFLQDETFKIDVVNLGLDTIKDFAIRYRMNQDSWNEVILEDTLLSASTKQISIPNTVDLSEVRDHYLQVVVHASEDVWPWNDSLYAIIDHYEFPDLSISYIDHDTLNRDFINLNALVENHGNIPADGFKYEVVIDEEFRFSGRSNTFLEPGDSKETSLNLINIYYSWLETGWHNYRVELVEDSVVQNNTVTGSIFWIATSVGQEFERQIRVYPNPVSEVLYFEFAEDIDTPCKLSITDITGRVVMQRELGSENMQVQLRGELPSEGIYNLNIRDTNEIPVFFGSFVYIK